LISAQHIFWDFDGVIKESLDVKGDAFVELFANDQDLAFLRKVRDHHNANGGVPRRKKIQEYLSWIKEESSPSIVDAYCERFGKNLVESVIKSQWVDGVEKYLAAKKTNQVYYLLSATPQAELEEIIDRINLSNTFEYIIGAPTEKRDAIRGIISELKLKPLDCVMIGDSIPDYEAACENSINFMLRKHQYNEKLFDNYQGPFIKNFLNL
jgi:phosphoglycolate phosphatase-like HAD superfamily hydrolase